jgi:hypothetical protein
MTTPDATFRIVTDPCPLPGAVGGSRCLTLVDGLPCWLPKAHDGVCLPLPRRTETQRRVTT